MEDKNYVPSSSPEPLWQFSPEQLKLLLLQDGIAKYSVDLKKITSSAHMLNVVFDVSTKTWANHQIVGELITNLRELFDPQATLCEGGEDHKLDAERYLGHRCRVN